MKFICKIHGEVEPIGLLYSCPLQGSCPECGTRLVDIKGEIKIRSEEEAVRMRPELYKENYPEIYKKYFPEESGGCKGCPNEGKAVNGGCFACWL